MDNNNNSSDSSSDSASDSASDSSITIEIDPRYQNGKIYKVVCNNTGRIYIGSTYKTLENRLYTHEKDYKRYLNDNFHYISCFDIIKDCNYTIELIKDFPCNNRTELEREEGKHQLLSISDENINCVNRYVAGRTREERLAFKRQKFTCPCGGKYTRTHKAEHFKSKKHQKYIVRINTIKQMAKEIITEIVNNALENVNN